MKTGGKILTSVCVVLIVAIMGLTFAGCQGNADHDSFTLNGWEYIALQRLGKSASDVDITKLRVEDFIDLRGISDATYLYSGGEKAANEEGWYPTLIDNFDVKYETESGLDPEIWTTSRHDVRWESQKKSHPEYANYWCSKAVSVEDGVAVIKAGYEDDHVCEICNSYGYKKGRFTGGFETRAEVVTGTDANGKREYSSNILWAQAFGYYEARIKFPDADGMWSAFWLQGNEMREIGYDGVDGTEIDVYESAFRKNNDKVSRMGHALLWNGYGKSGKVDDQIVKLEQDLYDGEFHTFSLLWTPDCYVFFIDGYATYATNGGGVCRVPEFLRFTNEIDAGDGYGPHGQVIGKFSHDITAATYVDYIRVYQNENYEKCVAPSIDGKPYSKDNNFESAFKSDYDRAN
ncbi:MAG: family 16 glycosylhydrolase [Clostridia bacterium]|nr:family 16 glycosylhydrolase [Clostridia bacterium]